MQLSTEPYSSAVALAVQSVRDAVFTQEQGIASALVSDGQDPHAVHVLARCNGTCVGVGRMLPDGHIGRVAVLGEHRRKGVGRSMIRALIEYARDHQYPRVYLAAQDSAIAFYTRLGFILIGPTYEEAGIPHRDMEIGLMERGRSDSVDAVTQSTIGGALRAPSPATASTESLGH